MNAVAAGPGFPLAPPSVKISNLSNVLFSSFLFVDFVLFECVAGQCSLSCCSTEVFYERA